MNKILLADDHKVFRESISSLINKEGDSQIIAEADNGREAIRKIEKYNPDLVIMDVTMPEMNGIHATRLITRDFPEIKVLALSIHAEPLFVKKMFAAGVKGYLLKDCSFYELKRAIKFLLKGQVYLSPEINEVVISNYLNQTKTYSPLTSREKEIAQLLAEGKATKYIASSLYISIKTVESHRQRIMKKLGINNLAELVKYAIREGLTTI